MKDTKFHLFIILLAFLAIAAFGFEMWYFTKHSPSFQKQSQEKPVTTGIVEKKETTIPQENVYKNEEFGFEVTLPDGAQNPPSTQEYVDPLTGKHEVQYGFDLFSVSVIKNISPEKFAEAISDNTQFGPQPTNITIKGIPAVYLEIGKMSGDVLREYFFSQNGNTVAVYFFEPKTSNKYQEIINSFRLGN